MTEEHQKQPVNGDGAPKIDWEWEYLKLQGRITDILGMIDELKKKDRSLSARISRLRQDIKNEPGEGWEEPEEGGERFDPFEGLDLFNMEPEQLQEAFDRIVALRK